MTDSSTPTPTRPVLDDSAEIAELVAKVEALETISVASLRDEIAELATLIADHLATCPAAAGR